MFNLQARTLHSFIASKKTPTGPGSGGHNKILEKYQVEAIHQFIWLLLTYSIQPSHRVVFGAIITLKHA